MALHETSDMRGNVSTCVGTTFYPMNLFSYRNGFLGFYGNKICGTFYTMPKTIYDT